MSGQQRHAVSYVNPCKSELGKIRKLILGNITKALEKLNVNH